MKLKIKNIFLISFLAVASVFGAFSAVVASQKSGDNQVVEKAEAATSTTVYYAISTSYTVKCNVNRQGDADNWQTYTMSKNGKTYYGTPIYSVTFTDLYDGLGCLQFQLYNGSSWVSQEQPISSWTSVSTYNGKMKVYGVDGWKTYTYDTNPTYKLYIDATNWSSGIGSYTPFCHFWNDGLYTSYSDVNGVNITSVSGGGTYSNKKWWSFTINPYTDTSLKVIFAYNNYGMQTGNIDFGSNNTAYYVSATKSAAPEGTFTSDGTIYKIVKYKKLGSAASTTLGTDYVLGGESYQTPSLPGSETGYTTPTKWNSSEAGTGTEYTPTTDWISNISSNQTLYALYTAATYTITYDRNNAGSSSATATRTKEYNVSHTILDPSTFEWTPTSFKRFIGWADSREGTATHSVGDSYTTNAAKTFYYNEDWYTYRYKVNSGSWVYLETSSNTPPSGVQAQFTPSSAQELPLGGILTFEYSTDGGTNWSSLNSITYEDGGNYDPSTGIKLATYDTIFLKLTTSGTYVCWVPGISERTILITSSSTGTTGTSYSMIGTSSTQTVTTAAVYVEKGQYVRRCYAGTAYNTYYSGGTYSSHTSDCFENIEGNDAVLCTVTGVYTIYNQAGNTDSWWNIWVERHDELSAGFLAQKFNSTISSICTDVVGGSKGLSDLQAAWGSNSDSALYYHFNGQPSDTMDYFATNSGTSNTDILACVERYDYIERKYGTTALPDFLGRNNGYSAAIRSFSPLAVFGSDDNNITTIIIVVASSVALLSVTALSILVIKKRKNKEQE